MKTPCEVIDELQDLYEEIIDHWASGYSKKKIEDLEKSSLHLDDKFKSKLKLIRNLFKELL